MDRLFLMMLMCCVVVGCKKSTAPGPTPATATPSNSTPAMMDSARPTDLSQYGIPGVIDLPTGLQITLQMPSTIAIDRDDDPFDLRVTMPVINEGSLAERRKALQQENPFDIIAEQADGFAAFYRSPMNNHQIEVYREVMLEGKKFVAIAYIVDERASKELTERVWKVARSLRPK